MNRYAVRTGSALALLAAVLLGAGHARAADPAAYTFAGKRIAIADYRQQPGGPAVAIDDSGLQTLLRMLAATVTYQPGQRYVLITTAEPVVVSFAIGDTRYDVGPISATSAFAPYVLAGQPYLPAD